MDAGLAEPPGGLAWSALADARSGVFSAAGERDGRSGRPLGVLRFEELTDELEGDEGGEELGEGVEAADVVASPRLCALLRLWLLRRAEPGWPRMEIFFFSQDCAAPHPNSFFGKFVSRNVRTPGCSFASEIRESSDSLHAHAIRAPLRAVYRGGAAVACAECGMKNLKRSPATTLARLQKK